MALQGDLRTVGFETLLQWIYTGHLTGDVSVTRASIAKRLVFAQGDLVSCTSNDPRETLPQTLLRRNSVPLEALLQAMDEQQKRGLNLGVILVSRCLIEPVELEAALRLATEEAVYDLFLWEDAKFVFTEQEYTRGMFLDLQLKTRLLLREGLRRQKLWREFSRLIPSREATFRPLHPPSERTTGQAGKVLAAVGPGRTLSEIALETQCSDFEAALWLKELCSQGVLAVSEAREDAPGGDALALVRRSLANAERHLDERRLDEAQRELERVLVLDPVCLRAQRGLVAVSEARHRQTLTALLPPTRRPRPCKTVVQLATAQLNAQEGFVLSRITGQFTVAEIVRQCPSSEAETLTILSSFVARGIVELRD